MGIVTNMTINERIKQRRIALGYKSHTAFGEAVGVSWQTVQAWERKGGTAPNRSRIAKVAAVLGTTPEWLLHGVGPADVDADPNQPPPPPAIEAPGWMDEDVYRLLTFYWAADADARAQILDYAATFSSHGIGNTVVRRNQG